MNSGSFWLIRLICACKQCFTPILTDQSHLWLWTVIHTHLGWSVSFMLMNSDSHPSWLISLICACEQWFTPILTDQSHLCLRTVIHTHPGWSGPFVLVNRDSYRSCLVRPICAYEQWFTFIVHARDDFWLWIYSRTSMARTSLGPWKFGDMGSSSHRGLIMTSV